MTLFRHEFAKVFRSRVLLLIAAGLLVLNGVLLYLNEFNVRQAVQYSPSAYNRLYSSLQGLSNQQAEERLEREYQQLLVYQELDSLLNSSDDAGDSGIAEHLAERYPTVDIPTLISSYRSGSYLKYAKEGFSEFLLLKETLEQVKRINGYDAYVQQIADDAKVRTQISIFAKPDTFAYRNILRTAEDYANLTHRELAFDRSKGVAMATQFLPTDLLAVLFMMVASIVLLTREKEQRLLPLAKSTYKGRAPLIISKLLVLAAVCVLTELLLYATDFAMAHQIYGFGDLGRAIQSVDGYMESTWPLTVGQYFLWFLLTKLIVYILVAWVILAIAVLCRTSIAVYVSMVIVFGLSAFFDFLVPPSSVMAFLKQMNLISFLNTYKLYSSYVNLNVFGQAVKDWTAFVVATAVALPVLFAGNVLLFGRQKISVSRFNLRLYWQEKWGRIYRGYAHVGIFRHESYKLFVANKVLLVLAIFIGFQVYSYEPIQERLYSKDDLYYKQYMLQLEGELTPEKERFLQEEQKRFDDANAELAQASGMAPSAALKLTKLLDKQQAFNRVKAQADYLREMERSYGLKGWFLYDAGYRLLTDGGGERVSPDLSLALLLSIVLIASLSAVFTYELQTRMIRIVSPTLYGRGRMFYAKLALALLIGTAAYALVYAPRIVGVFHAYGTRALQAPAGSMTHLSHVTSGMTILQYLIVLSVIRYIGMMMAILIILMLSVRLKSLITVMLASTAILALPILLAMIGIRQFDYLPMTPLLTGNVLFKSYTYGMLEHHRMIYLLGYSAGILLTAFIFVRKLRKGQLRLAK